MAPMLDDAVKGTNRRPNRFRWLVWGSAAALLSVPAIAMALSAPGVDWGPEDFIIMGILLGMCCAGYEFAAWLSGNWAYRAGAAAAIAVSLLTVWVNLAVGMLGDEDNPDNLLFGLVILVGMIGAIQSGFAAKGMALSMEAAALAQGAMTVYALVAYGPVATLVGMFILPWLVAAQLFRLADRQEQVGTASGDVR